MKKELESKLTGIAGPEVTIGMAVYNGAQFIEHALDAVLAQTYPNFTVIVSDNASTDGTWEILQRLAARDTRILPHRQEENIGMIPNFRFVLDKAQTEYFMWHADDDWIDSNYLKELLSVFEREAGCVLACPFGARIDNDGRVLHREAFPSVDSRTRFGRMRELLSHPEGAWIYGLWRTASLRKVWAIVEELRYVWACDAVALLHVILNDQVRGTDKTIFYYRINYPSLYALRPDTRTKMLRFMAHYLRFHFRLLRTSSIPLREKVLIVPWLLNHSLVSLFERPYKRFLKQPVKRMIKAVGFWPLRPGTGRS